MAKVISFCLWGDKPQYTVGAIKNAELAREIYPEWECWYFMNSEEYDQGAEHIDSLEKMNNVRIFGVGRERHHLMLNRFEAIDGIHIPHHCDIYPEIILSRDCDSRLSSREKIAVDEWIYSDKGFHTMHDHYHHSVPILGGMFGIKAGVIQNMSGLVEDWLKMPRQNDGQYWQIDQEFLTHIVWPKVKNNVMNHADFHTNIWPGIPFKSKRNGREFVGATYDEYDMINLDQARQLWG